MKVAIVAPSGLLWQGEASQVRVPAIDGDLGILEGHTPLMALLSKGNVVISAPEGEKVMEVRGGFVTVDSNVVSVLVDQAGKVNIA